jgi:hypothetical protein
MQDVTTPPAYNKEEKTEYDLQSFTDEQVVVNEPETQQVEEHQFTWRSAIIGSLLGCLVGKHKTNCILNADLLIPLSL